MSGKSGGTRGVLGGEAGLLAALDEIGRLAAAAPDLATLGGGVTAAVRRALGLVYVSFVRVDHAQGVAEYVADSSEFALAVKPGDTQPLDRGIVGLCVREGQPVYVEDVAADPAYVEIIPGIVSELAVPVVVSGRVFAVLNCESRERAGLRKRRAFVEVVANRLGAALENAGLLHEREAALAESRRGARQLAFLNEVARIASADLELRPMLQRITDALAGAFHWEFVACATVDTVANRFVCEAVSSRVPTDVVVGYGRALGSGVVGEVAQTGRPILLDDVTTWPNYVETLPGARAELCVPVLAGGRVIAVLNLESARPAAFHDQLPLLSTVAEQVSGAIASARLYAETRRRAAQLAMVSEVARAAMEMPDLPALLDRVVHDVRERLGLPLVAILLVDETATQLELAAHAGDLPLTVVRGARWPINAGVVGRAISRGEPQLLLDVRGDPDYVALNPDVTSELAIPIRAGDRTLGVMNVEATSPDAFGPETVLVLRTLVDQVAGAIRMATMNRRLSQANKTLVDLFSRYVAPDVAELLLLDPGRFHNRGERRDVTVMFADIRGFTRLSQRLDSQQVLALLNEAYGRLADAVFIHRGSINRFLGDGFMAVFGMPERLADHAHAAVLAAQEIQRRADALTPRWIEATGEPLRVVCAANAGEVTVGSVGDPRHMEFTVLGDPVNVASRLETEAKVRDVRILVTGSVADAVGGRIAMRSLGAVELRGRDGSVALFEVV